MIQKTTLRFGHPPPIYDTFYGEDEYGNTKQFKIKNYSDVSIQFSIVSSTYLNTTKTVAEKLAHLPSLAEDLLLNARYFREKIFTSPNDPVKKLLNKITTDGLLTSEQLNKTHTLLLKHLYAGDPHNKHLKHAIKNSLNKNKQAVKEYYTEKPCIFRNVYRLKKEKKLTNCLQHVSSISDQENDRHYFSIAALYIYADYFTEELCGQLGLPHDVLTTAKSMPAGKAFDYLNLELDRYTDIDDKIKDNIKVNHRALHKQHNTKRGDAYLKFYYDKALCEAETGNDIQRLFDTKNTGYLLRPQELSIDYVDTLQQAIEGGKPLESSVIKFIKDYFMKNIDVISQLKTEEEIAALLTPTLGKENVDALRFSTIAAYILPNPPQIPNPQENRFLQTLNIALALTAEEIKQKFIKGSQCENHQDLRSTLEAEFNALLNLQDTDNKQPAIHHAFYGGSANQDRLQQHSSNIFEKNLLLQLRADQVPFNDALPYLKNFSTSAVYSLIFSNCFVAHNKYIAITKDTSIFIRPGTTDYQEPPHDNIGYTIEIEKLFKRGGPLKLYATAAEEVSDESAFIYLKYILQPRLQHHADKAPNSGNTKLEEALQAANDLLDENKTSDLRANKIMKLIRSVYRINMIGERPTYLTSPLQQTSEEAITNYIASTLLIEDAITSQALTENNLQKAGTAAKGIDTKKLTPQQFKRTKALAVFANYKKPETRQALFCQFLTAADLWHDFLSPLTPPARTTDIDNAYLYKEARQKTMTLTKKSNMTEHACHAIAKIIEMGEAINYQHLSWFFEDLSFGFSHNNSPSEIISIVEISISTILQIYHRNTKNSDLTPQQIKQLINAFQQVATQHIPQEIIRKEIHGYFHQPHIILAFTQTAHETIVYRPEDYQLLKQFIGQDAEENNLAIECLADNENFDNFANEISDREEYLRGKLRNLFQHQHFIRNNNISVKKNFIRYYFDKQKIFPRTEQDHKHNYIADKLQQHFLNYIAEIQNAETQANNIPTPNVGWEYDFYNNWKVDVINNSISDETIKHIERFEIRIGKNQDRSIQEMIKLSIDATSIKADLEIEALLLENFWDINQNTLHLSEVCQEHSSNSHNIGHYISKCLQHYYPLLKLESSQLAQLRDFFSELHYAGANLAEMTSQQLLVFYKLYLTIEISTNDAKKEATQYIENIVSNYASTNNLSAVDIKALNQFSQNLQRRQPLTSGSKKTADSNYIDLDITLKEPGQEQNEEQTPHITTYMALKTNDDAGPLSAFNMIGDNNLYDKLKKLAATKNYRGDLNRNAIKALEILDMQTSGDIEEDNVNKCHLIGKLMAQRVAKEHTSLSRHLNHNGEKEFYRALTLLKEATAQDYLQRIKIVNALIAGKTNHYPYNEIASLLVNTAILNGDPLNEEAMTATIKSIAPKLKKPQLTTDGDMKTLADKLSDTYETQVTTRKACFFNATSKKITPNAPAGMATILFILRSGVLTFEQKKTHLQALADREEIYPKIQETFREITDKYNNMAPPSATKCHYETHPVDGLTNRVRITLDSFLDTWETASPRGFLPTLKEQTPAPKH